MKKISLLFLIFFWHIHAQETSFEWEDKPFKVLNLEEGYLGNNSLSESFYLKASRLKKRGAKKSYIYENYLLGNIHSVYHYNGINPSIFYQNDLKKLVLDPFLNLSKTIDLPVGTSLVSGIENRFFWLYNKDNLRLALYHINSNESRIEIPLNPNISPLSLSYKDNFLYLITKNSIYCFNQVGKKIEKLNINLIQNVFNYQNDLYILAADGLYKTSRTLSNKPVLVFKSLTRLKGFQIENESLWIWDEKSISIHKKLKKQTS